MDFNIEKYHLKSFSFFDFLVPAELKLLKNKLIRKEYSKGEYLFRENSYSKGVYLVRKGKVKIFQTNSDGKQTIVYIYRKGDYFGYRPLLAEEPNPVSAMSMDDVVVSFINRDLFIQLLNKSPQLAKKLLVVLTREFSVWINKMTIFSQYSVKVRVAVSLLILEQVYRRDIENEGKTNITISRDDFANFVGTAKETLVRMLRTFKDQMIITSKGTKITIEDHEALLYLLNDL